MRFFNNTSKKNAQRLQRDANELRDQARATPDAVCDVHYSKVVYFMTAAAAALILPFLTCIFQDLGYTDSQIGIINMIRPFGSLIGVFLFSALADKYHIHKQIMLVNTAIAAYLRALVLIFTPYVFVLILMVGTDFFGNAFGPLFDSTVIKSIAATGKPEKYQYSHQRLFSSLSNGVIAFAAGFIFQKYGLHIVTYIHLILTGVVLVIVNGIRTDRSTPTDKQKIKGEESTITFSGDSVKNSDRLETVERSIVVKPNHGEHVKEGFEQTKVTKNNDEYISVMEDGKAQLYRLKETRETERTISSKKENIGKATWRLLSADLGVVLVHIVTILIGALMASVTWAQVYVRGFGATTIVYGAATLVMGLSECAVFLIAEKMLKIFGTHNLLAIVGITFAVRAWAWGQVQSPWVYVGIEVLHGICFGLTWPALALHATGVAKKVQKTSGDVNALSQGIMNGLFNGIGVVVGAGLGGFLCERQGPLTVFRYVEGGGITIAALMSMYSVKQFISGPKTAKGAFVNLQQSTN